MVTGWAGGGSWIVVVPGFTADAWVGATCSGCARKVTGTEGCVGGGASGCGWAGVATVAAVAAYMTARTGSWRGLGRGEA